MLVDLIMVVHCSHVGWLIQPWNFDTNICGMKVVKTCSFFDKCVMLGFFHLHIPLQSVKTSWAFGKTKKLVM